MNYLNKVLPQDIINYVIYPYLLPVEQYNNVLSQFNILNNIDKGMLRICKRCKTFDDLEMYVNKDCSKLYKTCFFCRSYLKGYRKSVKILNKLNDTLEPLNIHICNKNLKNLMGLISANIT